MSFENAKPTIPPPKMPILSPKLRDSHNQTPSNIFINRRCKIAFYSYDSQISKRKASIGYGKKPDWTQIMEFSPVATKYEQKSLFETGK